MSRDGTRPLAGQMGDGAYDLAATPDAGSTGAAAAPTREAVADSLRITVATILIAADGIRNTVFSTAMLIERMYDIPDWQSLTVEQALRNADAIIAAGKIVA